MSLNSILISWQYKSQPTINGRHSWVSFCTAEAKSKNIEKGFYRYLSPKQSMSRLRVGCVKFKFYCP